MKVKLELSEQNLGLLLYAVNKGMKHLDGIEKEGLHVIFARLKTQAESQGVDLNVLVNDTRKAIENC